MLFTILFGLSMDYEVFLLRAIQEEHVRGASNDGAVRAGIARTGSLISSAAAIMACLFASFAMAELAATREFGLGLAVAVVLDATLIRLVLIPAAMRLLGEANWWFPQRRPA
jgi:putative drug exporter of the RND superfamily